MLQSALRYLPPALLLAANSIFAQELVRIPSGTLEVADQITTLRVRVTTSEFRLGRTEVMQSDYEAVTGSNPSFYRGAQRPVENVSWWDAIRYCNLRSVREKLSPCYDLASGQRVESSCTGYRLPTEAEWLVASGGVPKPEQLAGAGQLGDASTKSLELIRKRVENGTAPVGSHAANSAGLSDMWGNVWEWCEDHFSVRSSPDAVRDPAGPTSGLARVIRGGSFVSSTSRWSRDYRSSKDADTRSRYTGFRVAQSLPAAAAVDLPQRADFFQQFRQAPAGFETATGSLSTLAPTGTSAQAWDQAAAKLRSQWTELLAPPKPQLGRPAARLVRTVEQRNFTGQIFDVELEPGVGEKVYVLRPPSTARGPRPVLIVPFYDIDTPAAADLGGRNYAPDRGMNAFAYTAAQHGYIAVAVRWFGESYGESYTEAVANLAIRHPGATGLGKWVTDSRRVVDFIESLPDADPARIGIMGHSLGGKMALYGAAFDERIRAIVASEPGIGFRMSNYDDYWYFGDKLAQAPAGMDQHQLIALLAPRPFLLIGGDEYDKAESWHYINAARQVYQLLGKPEHVGYFNHHTGHTPSPGSVTLAFDWLDRFLRP